MGLVLKLVAGIVAGILIGLYMPEWVSQTLLTFKTLFGQLLFFTIPLLILFFITSGIASLPSNSGKMLGKTLGIAYASTVTAGIVAFFAASIVVPWLTTDAQSVSCML